MATQSYVNVAFEKDRIEFSAQSQQDFAIGFLTSSLMTVKLSFCSRVPTYDLSDRLMVAKAKPIQLLRKCSC